MEEESRETGSMNEGEVGGTPSQWTRAQLLAPDADSVQLQPPVLPVGYPLG